MGKIVFWLVLFLILGLVLIYGIIVLYAVYFVILCIDYKLYGPVCCLCGEVVRSLKAGERCPICLAPLIWSTQSLACGHRFHTRCIHRWLSDKKTCPCCRAAVL